MENVITFTGFWYLIKRTTNSTGIRANWINCPLCKVLLNLYIFPVQNQNCTETYLGPLHRSYIIYLYWSKSSQNVLNVKSLKEFSLREQYQYVKGFRRFHTGLSPLAIFTFWVFTLWRLTLVLYCKRKQNKRYLLEGQTQRVFSIKRLGAFRTHYCSFAFFNFALKSNFFKILYIVFEDVFALIFFFKMLGWK